MDVDWEKLARTSVKFTGSPVFRELAQSSGKPGGFGEGDAASWRETVRALPPAEQAAAVSELVIAQVAATLGMAPDAIDPNGPLTGMDSLMAVELKVRLEDHSGCTLPIDALNADATAARLAERLLKQIGVDRETNAGPAAPMPVVGERAEICRAASPHRADAAARSHPRRKTSAAGRGRADAVADHALPTNRRRARGVFRAHARQRAARLARFDSGNAARSGRHFHAAAHHRAGDSRRGVAAAVCARRHSARVGLRCALRRADWLDSIRHELRRDGAGRLRRGRSRAGDDRSRHHGGRGVAESRRAAGRGGARARSGNRDVLRHRFHRSRRAALDARCAAASARAAPVRSVSQRRIFRGTRNDAARGTRLPRHDPRCSFGRGSRRGFLRRQRHHRSDERGERARRCAAGAGHVDRGRLLAALPERPRCLRPVARKPGHSFYRRRLRARRRPDPAHRPCAANSRARKCRRKFRSSSSRCCARRTSPAASFPRCFPPGVRIFRRRSVSSSRRPRGGIGSALAELEFTAAKLNYEGTYLDPSTVAAFRENTVAT